MEKPIIERIVVNGVEWPTELFEDRSGELPPAAQEVLLAVEALEDAESPRFIISTALSTLS